MGAFAENLQNVSSNIIKASERCLSEEATKQFLVLPFLASLGYNIFDPSEVVPEFHADFSEKYRNRVDYAIVRDGSPVIGIEVKQCGARLNDDRGQLRAYFNACLTVKLGIITDGVRYECFADTDEPNIMDQTPFLMFDLNEVVKGEADSRVLQGIEDLSKSRFDPANLGAEARRKLMLNQFISMLSVWHERPSDGFVRLLLEECGFKGNKTAKVVDDCRDLAGQAFSLFVNRLILRRVGVDGGLSTVTTAPVDVAPLQENSGGDAAFSDGIVTTEIERRAYEYTRRRLSYLVKDDSLYNEIDNIDYVDLRTTFKVFYKKQNVGSLFNLKEKSGGLMVFEFPALENRTIETKSLNEIDECLLESFRSRVDSLLKAKPT